MKVDIWIYDDYGGEDHKENLTYGEAQAFLQDARFQERFTAMLTSDFALDTIIEKLKEQQDESNTD